MKLLDNFFSELFKFARNIKKKDSKNKRTEELHVVLKIADKIPGRFLRCVSSHHILV